MAVTYATARAACVARYGEPPHSLDVHGVAFAWWPRSPPCADPGSEFDGLALDDNGEGPCLVATTGGASVCWTLAGPGDVTPLPAALDAADAFLRTHATTATKGP